MNQMEYIYHLFVRTHELLQKHLIYKQYSTKAFFSNLLEWGAETLDSKDAFLLSWPDSKGKMWIQDPSFINTTKLKACESINYFKELSNFLNGNEPSMYRNKTSDIEELQNVNINSFLVTKVVMEQEEFRSKLLLMICNRNKPALKGQIYLSYDRLFCDIVQWVFKLHINDLYEQNLRNYTDAKEKYRDNKSKNSILLKSETSNKLLDLYDQYNANPSLDIIYDWLDTYITLFNTKLMSGDEFKKVLERCKEYCEGIRPKHQAGDLDLLKYTLARGYFALGIQEKEYWENGRELLEQKKIVGSVNNGPTTN